MSTVVGQLMVMIGADASMYTKTMTGVQAKAAETSGFIRKHGMIIGAAFVAIGVMAVSAALKQNKALAEVGTLIPGQIKLLKRLGVEAQASAIKFALGYTEEVLPALYETVSAYGDAANATGKLNIALKLAKAGSTGAVESVKLLSAWTKGYGDTSEKAMRQASDLSFKIVELGQTTMPELAASMGKAIPLAVALGVTQVELAAGFATLTGVTGSAAEVSTQLSGVFRSMVKPSDEMKLAIKNAGFETAKGMISALGYVGAMHALIAETDGTQESIAALFPNIRGLNAVLSLGGPQAEMFAEKLEKLGDSAGTTGKALKAQTEEANKAGFELDRFMVVVTKLLSQLGQHLLPALGMWAKGMSLIITISGEFLGFIGDFLSKLKPLNDAVARVGRELKLWGEIIVNMIPGLQSSSEQANDLADKVIRLAKNYRASIGAIEGWAKAALLAGDSLDSIAEKIKLLTVGRMPLYQDEIEILALLEEKAAEAGEELADVTDDQSESVKKLTIALTASNEEIEKQLKAHGASPAAIKKMIEALDELRAKQLELRNYTEALSNEMTTFLVTGIKGALLEAAEALGTLPPKYKAILARVVKVTDDSIQDMGDLWEGYGDKIADEMREAADDTNEVIETIVEKLPDIYTSVGRVAGAAFLNSFKQTMRNIGDLGRAISISFGEAFSGGLKHKLTGAMGADFWKTTFGQVIAVGIPIVGQLVSALVSGIFSSLFGGGNAAERNAERQQKAQEELNDRLAKFNELIDEAISNSSGWTDELESLARSLGNNASFIDMVTDAIERQKRIIDDLIAAIQKMPDSVYDSIQSLEGLRRGLEKIKVEVRSTSREMKRLLLEDKSITFRMAAKFEDGVEIPGQRLTGIDAYNAVLEAIERAKGKRGQILAGKAKEILRGIDDPQFKILVKQLLEAERAKIAREEMIRRQKIAIKNLQAAKQILKTSLDKSKTIIDRLEDILETLRDIDRNLGGRDPDPKDPLFPKLHTGGKVLQDQLAFLQAGEVVIPAAAAYAIQATGNAGAGNTERPIPRLGGGSTTIANDLGNVNVASNINLLIEIEGKQLDARIIAVNEQSVLSRQGLIRPVTAVKRGF